MKIEKEWKNVSTAVLFRILHQKVLKVWLEKFFQFFMTLDTIFFFFKFTDTLRNFEDFPDYHESTSRPRINHDFNFTRPVSTTLSPISWVSYPSRQYFNITGSSEKSLAQISWVL